MKIAISAESTIDLPKELLKEFDIFTVPFKVVLGEKTYNDGDIDPREIFTFVEENNVLPKTNAVNAFEYEEHFNSLKEKGYDGIIHITLSSALSSAYSHAVYVASKMDNVYIIDSKSLSTGIALLAIYGSKLVKKGLKIKEIVEKIENRTKNVQASFILNNLDYLYKGGRCSSLQRFGVNLLRLKPQILVTNEGKMISGKIYRGNNRTVFKKYCFDTLEKFYNPDLDVAFVTVTVFNEEAIQNGINILKDRGFKHVYRTVAGSTISSHCGPKCIGILFLNDGNQEDQE